MKPVPEDGWCVQIQAYTFHPEDNGQSVERFVRDWRCCFVNPWFFFFFFWRGQRLS